MTQLHFFLIVCNFSTYGPCLLSLAHVREWVKGVFIDDHGLRTVNWPMDHNGVCRPRHNQFYWAYIFGSFWPHWRLWSTDCVTGYGLSISPLFAPANFFWKTYSSFVLAIGCYITKSSFNDRTVVMLLKFNPRRFFEILLPRLHCLLLMQATIKSILQIEDQANLRRSYFHNIMLSWDTQFQATMRTTIPSYIIQLSMRKSIWSSSIYYTLTSWFHSRWFTFHNLYHAIYWTY